MIESETQKAPVVRIERTISAPAEIVYRAWLDPDVVGRWVAPPGHTVTKVEVDEGPGGHWGIWHTSPEGKEDGFEADIVELVPAEKIVLSWHFVGPEKMAGRPLESRLTLRFDGTGEGGTVLTLVHERLEEINDEFPEMVGKINGGWGTVLDRLPAVVQA